MLSRASLCTDYLDGELYPTMPPYTSERFRAACDPRDAVVVTIRL